MKFIINSPKFFDVSYAKYSSLGYVEAIRPTRLPRGIPCIVVASIYHPPNARDSVILDYLIATLISVESLYPGCGLLLTGDFNRLKINRSLTQFKMKQLVNLATRGYRTLDLILSNMHQVYTRDSVVCIPPFGLSDHNGIFLRPQARLPDTNSSRRSVVKRDTRSSQKSKLGRYLNSIKWSILDDVKDCTAKEQLLVGLITIGVDATMPLNEVKFHPNDLPWVTADFKKLIKSPQKAFSYGDRKRFNIYGISLIEWF